MYSFQWNSALTQVKNEKMPLLSMWPREEQWQNRPASRGGHRHLQIGQMLDTDLISEPPHAPSPKIMYPKCGNLCGQRGRKRFIASWGLRMSHICLRTLCPSPQGYMSKVESRHFAHQCQQGPGKQMIWRQEGKVTKLMLMTFAYHST